MSKLLTVFTPTYNRKYILGRLYESLVRQTNNSFVWLVVDDGSQDETESLIEEWQKEGLVNINYVRKINQGMHSAHNVAFEHIDTPYAVCIDSDDYMPDDAVYLILKRCEEVKDMEDCAGVIGLDADTSGEIIGKPFPEGLKWGGVNVAKKKYGVRGDKKIIFKSKVLREYPAYPIFEGERLVPLGTLYLMIEQRYHYLMVNEVYCNVEYMPDGSTKNILSQYRNNPRGFAYERRLRLKYESGIANALKQWTHLVSSCLFVGSFSLCKGAQKAYLFPLVLPTGFLLNIYIRSQTKRS